MWRSEWGSSWAMRRARHRGAAHPPIWGHIVGKRSGGPTSHANLLCRARVWLVQQGVRPRRAFPLPSSERGSAIEAPIMLRPRNVAASRGSSRRLGARCGPVALLLLAALAPATAVGQCAPQPVFTELFAYDPAVPSQLLGKWLGSQQMPAREDIERQIAVSSRNSRGRSAPPDARAAGRRWRPGRE
jgi:hypothetical protein